MHKNFFGTVYIFIENNIQSPRKSIGKSPGFVPFGANMTHFGAKPTIPGLRITSHVSVDPKVGQIKTKWDKSDFFFTD